MHISKIFIKKKNIKQIKFLLQKNMNNISISLLQAMKGA